MAFQINQEDAAFEWGDAHRFSPAPRHRRRIISSILKGIEFDSCLDAGCAQPYLLEDLRKQSKQVFGCDVSHKVVEANSKNFPGIQFETVDIARGAYPADKKFDLVISSEVLEHIAKWQDAIKNLAFMSAHYLLITVPSGKMYGMDRLVGHVRHFTFEELRDELKNNGFTVILHKKWGMPFHSLYKRLINTGNYKKTYARFSVSSYGFFKKLFSNLLYFLFYFNDIFTQGEQLFVLAQRQNTE